MKSRIVNFVLICIIVFMTTACTPEADWIIPEDFTTFEDDSGLFSISYPSNWRVNLEIISQLENFIGEYMKDINEDIPVEQTSLLFLAGIPEVSGYHPNVNIVIEPLPGSIRTIRGVVNGQVAGLESYADEFHEIAREKVKVDGRDAYILEYEATYPNLGSVHALVLITMAGGNAWTVTCTCLDGLDDYDQHADDFQSIVRSLRIHK
jgi:hypothetical protein